ncbi:MAG: hypothetical protein ACP5I3_09065 [Thermoproteus sp.]
MSASQTIQVNFNKPAGYIPPGRTALYTATGSGNLSIYIGNDGDPSVNVYIEADGYVSNPIAGNVGTGGYISVQFNSYLVIYADNPGYTQALAPSIVVTGTVTPPAPPPTQTAGATTLGIDIGSLLNMFMYVMLFIMMFRMLGQVMSAFSGSSSARTAF